MQANNKSKTSSQVRVLVVGPLPPPVGGVETFTAALLESREMQNFARKHCDLSKRRSKDKQGKFDVANFFWALVHFKRMFSRLVTFRPNVVYMPLTATWSGFLRDGVLATVAKLSGARVIGHVHGGWFDRILTLVGWRARIVQMVLSRFDVLLMLGTKWRDLVSAYGYRGNIQIVPSTYRRALSDQASIFHRNYDERNPSGLFVGHVGPGKGILDVLRAIRELKEQGKEIHIVIVGPPQFEGDWQKVLAARSALELDRQVEMTGPLEGEALYARFEAASYLLLPSYFEGLPIVLFEAGLFGLPVITTPVGSIPDLIKHEKNGLLVSPGDIGAIAKAIERLHDNSLLRERLGSQLRKDVKRYDPEVVCKSVALTISESMERQGV